MTTLTSIYEEAGFLLFYNEHLIMALPISGFELEYFGGKVKPEDNNDPLKTAFNTLVEKLGQQVLDDDWKTRIVPLHQKKIYTYLLKLTKDEYHKIANINQDTWLITESKDLTHITKRSTLVTKTVSAFIVLCTYHFVNYLEDFSKNKLTFRDNHEKLRARIMPSGEMYEYCMDQNTIDIFVEHFKKISDETKSNTFNLANFLNIKEIMCFTTT